MDGQMELISHDFRLGLCLPRQSMYSHHKIDILSYMLSCEKRCKHVGK